MDCRLLILAGLVLGTTMGQDFATTVDPPVCADNSTSKCWERPEDQCYGLYAPWSRAHCPVRCGFCQGFIPPCEDKELQCALYPDNICTADNYRQWALANCRKYCNICYVAAVQNISTTASAEATTQGNAVTDAPTATTAPPTPAVSATVPGITGQPATTAAGEIPGSVAKGIQTSIIIQGPMSPNGTNSCNYKGHDYKRNDRWNDGCIYECACMDPDVNRVVCTEKCTRWEITGPLLGCSLEREAGECCETLKCSAMTSSN